MEVTPGIREKLFQERIRSGVKWTGRCAAFLAAVFADSVASTGTGATASVCSAAYRETC